jgi:hypothetical protein
MEKSLVNPVHYFSIISGSAPWFAHASARTHRPIKLSETIVNKGEPV